MRSLAHMLRDARPSSALARMLAPAGVQPLSDIPPGRGERKRNTKSGAEVAAPVCARHDLASSPRHSPADRSTTGAAPNTHGAAAGSPTAPFDPAGRLPSPGRLAGSAYLGRKMRRVALEDIAVFASAEEWARTVREATRKAFPPATAAAILKSFSEE